MFAAAASATARTTVPTTKRCVYQAFKTYARAVIQPLTTCVLLAVRMGLHTTHPTAKSRSTICWLALTCRSVDGTVKRQISPLVGYVWTQHRPKSDET